jgi:spore coat protein A
MAFSVTKPLDTSVFPATALPVDLRPVHGAIESLTPTPGVPARDLVLFEGVDEFGRLKPMLGTTQDGALQWHDDITENPMVGDTEIWTVYNATADAHPVHLHLVSFQIVDRQAYKADVDPVTGAHTNIRLVGKPKPPAPEERGWKDTARMLPGEVTRVIAKFDREGLYVWHCHILSHEDHEMMRPYYVGVMPPMMTALQSGPSNGLAVSAGPVVPSVLGLGQNYPNPFNPTTFINFQLPSAADVDLRVYNVQGQEVRLLARGAYPAGRHSVVWDGRGDSGDLVPSGVYFYELKSGDLAFRKKMVMIR